MLRVAIKVHNYFHSPYSSKHTVLTGISFLPKTDAISRQTKSQETSTMTTTNSGTLTTPLIGSGQNHVGSQICQDDAPSLKQEETSKSEGTQAGGTLQHSNSLASTKSTSTGIGGRTKDYSDEMVVNYGRFH